MFRSMKIALLSSVLLLVGCDKRTVRTDRLNVPETISLEEWRQESITVKNGNPLVHPGKIYRKGNYLYINEVNKGIHVYDNSNPSAPINVGFVEIYQNAELAIYGDILYVNSYTDLILLDVSNPNEIHELNRLENVFHIYFNDVDEGYDYSYSSEVVDPNSVVITGWSLQDVEREIIEDDGFVLKEYNPWFTGNEGGPVVFTAENSISMNDASFSGGAGHGGSMAKFTIAGNKLFILDGQVIQCYDISTPSEPKFVAEENTSRVAQTLFPRGNQLFVGTTTGMMIYEISNTGGITLLSTFEHFTSCDPVVVEGDLAYVTLSSGCRNILNQLDVVDISDLFNPVLIKSYSFTHPLGLGVDGSTLFLCDDQDGLKVFDVKDPLSIDQNQLAHFSQMNAFDVIPYNDLLIMVGDDGIAQYDYSNVQQIVQLSSISIQ